MDLTSANPTTPEESPRASASSAKMTSATQPRIQKTSMSGRSHSTSVLVMSVGSKAPLLHRLRETMDAHGGGRLLGADLTRDCVGAAFVDEVVPLGRLEDVGLQRFGELCERYGVTTVVPTRDAELDFFAANRDALASRGVFVMVSPPEAVAVCRDKLAFARHLAVRGFPAIPTTTELPEDGEPFGRWVVKERFGAGSRGLLLDADRESALRHASILSSPVFQPFVAGREYSVDLYIARSGRPLGAVARTRDLVVNGEAQITTTCAEPEITALCLRLAASLGLHGHACMQLLRLHDGRLLFIECNARFGGASTLSVVAGLETFRWMLLESSGDDLAREVFTPSPVPLRQVRHAADLIQHDPRL